MTDQEAAAPAPAESAQDDAASSAMEAIYDRLTAGGEPEPEAEPPEAPAAEEAAPEADAAAEAAPEPEAEAPAPEAPPMPTDLSPKLGPAWQRLDEAGRAALVEVQREMGRRMADQGRIVQAVKPAHDMLVQAMRELPELANMTPEQVAQDVRYLAQVNAQLARDPLGAILSVAQTYGVTDALAQALSGRGADASQTAAVAQEVRQLRAMLQQGLNPAAIQGEVERTIAQKQTLDVVAQFAAGQPHWNTVEPHLPQFIELAQRALPPGTSAKDVLSRAYDMAIHAFPDLRPAPKAAAPAPAPRDPERTAEAIRATRVNVGARQPGPGTALTLDQKMAAAYDRAATGKR
jgi:hypothetical protein